MALYAYPVVGRTGLGNMLITWARAVVFAKENNARLIAPAWTNFFRLGPILRMEKDKRLYMGQFTNSEYITGFRRLVYLACHKRIKERDYNGQSNGVVYFAGHEEGMRLVQQYRDVIARELYRISNPIYQKSLAALPERFVGVHVRIGDFSKVGFALDNDFYIRAIQIAIERMGGDVPVLVFSDARQEQLKYLTDRFPSLRIMPNAPALQDMLTLSKSSILVGTNRSTFSAWAAVLGGMQSLWDKNGNPPDTFLGLKDFELV